MQYYFSPEDRMLYQFLEGSNLFLDAQEFLENHVERIQNAFEQMLEDLKKEEKTDSNRRVIRELDRNQFVDVVKHTFCIMTAKSMFGLYTNHQHNWLSTLTAEIWVTKMRENPKDEKYILLIDKAIEQCVKAIWQIYESDS